MRAASASNFSIASARGTAGYPAYTAPAELLVPTQAAAPTTAQALDRQVVAATPTRPPSTAPSPIITPPQGLPARRAGSPYQSQRCGANHHEVIDLGSVTDTCRLQHAAVDGGQCADLDFIADLNDRQGVDLLQFVVLRIGLEPRRPALL